MDRQKNTTAEPALEVATVSIMQALALKSAMRFTSCQPADACQSLCSHFGISRIEDLPASSYPQAQEWVYSRMFGFGMADA